VRRDLHRLCQAEAEPFGAAVRIEHTGHGHLKAIFAVGVRTAFVITSSTSGCWRRDLMVRADARRALRTLTT
jgi:hypothetical protein